jgi:iron complex outermembrane receptor protein
VKSSEGFYYRTKEAWALFVDGTIRPTSRLRISLGGRYSQETQRISGLFNSFVTSGPNIGAIAATPYNRANSARSSTYSKFTPRAAIVYELTPRTNVYASYSQGFRSGEWNQAIPNNDPRLWVDAKPETIDAFELGLKSSAPRLRYEVSAFYYDYKNLQVSGSMFVAGAIPVLTLQNAPKAEIYGVDASFDFDVTENLKVRAGSTWLHARYGDRFVYIGTGVNPNVVGFNVNSDPMKTFVNAGAAAQDLSGLQMARAPDFSAFVGAEYNFPIQDGGVRLAANLKYTDSYVVTDPSVWGGEPNAAYNARKALDPNALPNNTVLLAGTPYVARASEQRARQGSFVLLNASATWSDPTDRYYVRMWGTNLTDARYRLHYRPSGATYIPMAEPRTYGATIGYKF